MAKSKKELGRRRFLGTATAGAAGLVAGANLAPAQQPQAGTPRVTAPNAVAREAETGTPANVEVLTNERPGSDFMVDVLKSLGIEYICSNPGSSFRALHESVINYGGNRNPEFLTCCHEESAVGMAHGYAKIEGKPLAVFAHGTVGLQHAAMAIYNAYCDRVPVYVIFGNIANATNRRPGVEWAHSVQDGASLVRDFTKWDDAPASLTHFAESAVRAYKIAMTPPMSPIVLVADGDLQEDPIAADARLSIPKLTLAAPPQGESGAVAEAARLLWAAENPVIIADRAARTPAGMALLVELAEVLQAPVIDQAGRMNFPTRHPLNQTERSRALVGSADVILGLELTDFWGTVHSYRDQLQRTSQSITKPGAKLISITAGDLFLRSNYQDFERYPEVDLAIAADAEATLPSLIEAVKRLITPDRKRALDDRGAKLAAAGRDALERTRTEATYAWDARPISTARLSAELWAQIKNDDWSLVSDVPFVSRWPLRLWNFDKHYQYIGGSGGAGVGYGAPAAVGAALANRKRGRLSVSIQNDGDLMYAPAVLWTAAHHKIPLLSVMHNNRAYHQEVMHVQRMANRHNRGIDRAGIGTTLEDPNIDYSKIAQGLGVHAEGPITDPKDLGPALKRAVEIVRRGEPALVDVVTQPR
ncbi:MAG: thiamine pyrophosphate-binding protein [Acidobacteriia bacterium]|nr:thiamine pyrophosphate-binding protein [Terriglobia bacterium]